MSEPHDTELSYQEIALCTIQNIIQGTNLTAETQTWLVSLADYHLTKEMTDDQRRYAIWRNLHPLNSGLNWHDCYQLQAAFAGLLTSPSLNDSSSSRVTLPTDRALQATDRVDFLLRREVACHAIVEAEQRVHQCQRRQDDPYQHVDRALDKVISVHTRRRQNMQMIKQRLGVDVEELLQSLAKIILRNDQPNATLESVKRRKPRLYQQAIALANQSQGITLVSIALTAIQDPDKQLLTARLLLRDGVFPSIADIKRLVQRNILSAQSPEEMQYLRNKLILITKFDQYLASLRQYPRGEEPEQRHRFFEKHPRLDRAFQTNKPEKYRLALEIFANLLADRHSPFDNLSASELRWLDSEPNSRLFNLCREVNQFNPNWPVITQASALIPTDDGHDSPATNLPHAVPVWAP